MQTVLEGAMAALGLGSFVDEEPADIIAHNPAFFKDFTVVIATQMPQQVLVTLDAICREHGTARQRLLATS